MTDLSKSEQELVEQLAQFEWGHGSFTAPWDGITDSLKEMCFEGIREKYLPAIRSHVNAAVGAAVEACAKELEIAAKNMMLCKFHAKLGTANEYLVSSDAQPVIDKAKNWQRASKNIRTLYPAATEELEKRLEAATEAALPLACKAIIESLDGGEFSPASPLAKVKAELERRLAEARLEEAKWWAEELNNSWDMDGTKLRDNLAKYQIQGGKRIAELEAQSKGAGQ